MNLKVVVPNVLMAAGAAIAVGSAFFAPGLVRGGIFTGLVVAGVGWAWSKLVK